MSSSPISARQRSPLPEPVHQTAAVAHAATPPNLQPLSDAEIKVLTPVLQADIDHAVERYLFENPWISLKGQELESVKQMLLQDAITYLKTTGVEKPGGPITLQSLKEVGYTIPFATVGGASTGITLTTLPMVHLNLANAKTRDPSVVTTPPSPGAKKGRTSPEVLEKINADLGTQVKFPFVGQLEGFQMRELYIPMCRTKSKQLVVCGQSGGTAFTGVDAGQKSRQELLARGYPDRVEQLLLPYANLRKAAALNKYNEDKAAGRVPFFSKAEADQVDGIEKAYHLKAAIRTYDTATGRPGAFQRLTPAQQTVLFSRTYHQGIGLPNTKDGKQFYAAAVRGDWEAAAKHLLNYKVEPWYENRLKQEVELLRTESQNRRLGVGL